jgi:hypothetical protein
MKKMHLSVRKRRDYYKLIKSRKEIDERVKALRMVGTANDKELLKRSSRAIGKILKTLPEGLMRKAVHLAVVTFIPKSPRGRKPAHPHQDEVAA